MYTVTQQFIFIIMIIIMIFNTFIIYHIEFIFIIILFHLLKC